MNDPLATYLHDHLTGSSFAIELLETMATQYAGQELATFAQQLRSDIKEDQDALKQIIQVVGQTHIDLAEVLGWLGEKASQVKLRQDGPAAGLGTFEALEALTLGIRGKLALWRCLPLIRDGDARVPPLDFDALADRAEKQFAATEHQRLSLVPVTFGSKATSKVEVQPR